MIKFYAFITVFMSSLVCESWSYYVERNNANYVDFGEFIKRDNSNITYLTLNNGTEIQACEYLNATYDWIENGQVILDHEVKKVGLFVKYYKKDEKKQRVSEYEFDDINCLLFLMQVDEIPISDYIETVDSEILNETELFSEYEPEIYCNKQSAPVKYKTKKRPEIVNPIINDIQTGPVIMGEEVMVDFLFDHGRTFAIATEDIDVLWKKEDDPYKYWNCTKPSEDVTLEPFSGIVHEVGLVKVYNQRNYRLDLQIEESSEQIREFRQKLKKKIVTLHQRKDGVHIDFNLDSDTSGPIILRNFTVTEETENFYYTCTASNIIC